LVSFFVAESRASRYLSLRAPNHTCRNWGLNEHLGQPFQRTILERPLTLDRGTNVGVYAEESKLVAGGMNAVSRLEGDGRT
jgi:hypothetical protein